MIAIRFPHLLAALLATASLATTASAQFNVSPDEGTVGTSLVITAGKEVDFGDKAKVWLSQAGDKKKLALKVDKNASSSTELVCEVKKLDKNKLDEQFDVNVQPKGGDVITLENGFTARNTVIVGSGYEFPAGQATTVTAAFMGDKPAKVKLGGKPAKVSNWQPAGTESLSTGSFQVTPHKSLPNGVVDMELKTKAGTSNALGLGTVTGSNVGAPKGLGVFGSFGPDKFVSKPIKGQNPFAFSPTVGNQSVLTAGASKGTKAVYVFQLFFNNWQPGDGSQVLDAGDLVGGLPQWTVTEIKNHLPQTPTSYQFTTFNGSIDETSSTVWGLFSGTMSKLGAGPGPSTIEVTNGSFNAPKL